MWKVAHQLPTILENNPSSQPAHHPLSCPASTPVCLAPPQILKSSTCTPLARCYGGLHTSLYVFRCCSSTHRFCCSTFFNATFIMNELCSTGNTTGPQKQLFGMTVQQLPIGSNVAKKSGSSTTYMPPVTHCTHST